MKQMKAIITILILLLANCESLPVTSKALENNSDQLIWQTSWYSQAEGKKDSPYTGDSRKITAKSIFITPNFNQNTSHCPPGFKIDDNGKCIKVVSINQDDLLVTRLQSFFSQHQTTDDSTSIDYDYSLEDDEEATHYNLPLIPIINDNDTNINQELPPLPVLYDFTDESFRDRNNAQDIETVTSTLAPILSANNLITPINNDTENNENFSMEKTVVDGNSDNASNQNETRVNESDINTDQNDTTTVEESVADTTSVFTHFEDQFEDESNYTTTTALDEFVINESEKPQAEKTISSDKIASHLGDYFDAMLLNDSLLIDDSFAYENTTDSEFDVTTVEGFSEITTNDEDLMEVSNEEKASIKLLTEEKASTKLLIEEKASIELLNQEKASLELLNKEKALADLLSKIKASEDLSNSEKASVELSSSEKASVELANSEKASVELSSSEKASVELFNSNQAFSGFPLNQKASTELLSNQKAPTELLSSDKSFTRFVTVEKTFSRPSIVNGPFLIFGEPFSRPSSAEKASVELLNFNKVFPESPSKVFPEISSSLRPSSADSFEYSTLDTVEHLTHEKVKPPTLDAFEPSSIDNFEPSSIDNFEPLSVKTQESPKVPCKNKTETSANHEDVKVPIAQTTVPPTTTQIPPEFSSNVFPYENRIIKDDQQNSELENVEESNKFVYHHLQSADVSPTSVVRFPIYSEQRVRFPDEPSTSKSPPTSFSWPRDNGGGGLMRFWQDQPLINDFKFFSRGHSRGSGGNFHRQNSYRRSYR